MVPWRLLSLALALTPSCGTNAFKAEEPKNAADDATLDLERHDPSGAINILTDALAKDPGNIELLSILSLAYAERAGCDPLSFAANMAAAQSSGSGVTGTGAAAGTSGLTALFSVVPDATVPALADIDEAVSILSTQIPAAERQTYDTFKLALFETASMVLHLKSLDTLGTGTLSPAELQNLTPAAAEALLAQLGSAQALIAAADPNNPATAQAAAAIGKYQTQIDAEPGATPADKLKNYLAANPNAATSTDTGTGTGTGS